MNQDDVDTLVTCLCCLGRGREVVDGYARVCTGCAGNKMVTPEQQSMQRLRWPKEKSDAPSR